MRQSNSISTSWWHAPYERTTAGINKRLSFRRGIMRGLTKILHLCLGGSWLTSTHLSWIYPTICFLILYSDLRGQQNKLCSNCKITVVFIFYLGFFQMMEKCNIFKYLHVNPKYTKYIFHPQKRNHTQILTSESRASIQSVLYGYWTLRFLTYFLSFIFSFISALSTSLKSLCSLHEGVFSMGSVSQNNTDYNKQATICDCVWFIYM